MRVLALFVFICLFFPTPRAVGMPTIKVDASDDSGSGSIDQAACLTALATYNTSCGFSMGDPIQMFQNICSASDACKGSLAQVVQECSSEEYLGSLGIVPDVEEYLTNICTGDCTSEGAGSCQADCGVCVDDLDEGDGSFIECIPCLEYFHCLSAPEKKKSDPCFPANATVRLASDGSAVPLSSLRVGDAVVALSPWGETVVDRVSPLSVANARGSSSSPLHRIVVRSGEGAHHSLHLTGSHRLPEGEGGCCGSLSEAASIRSGDTVWHVGPKGGISSVEVVSNTVLGRERGPLFSPVLDYGGLPVVDGIVTSPASSAESKLLWYAGGLVTPGLATFLSRHVLLPLPRLVD